jgi:hypothetical protein
MVISVLLIEVLTVELNPLLDKASITVGLFCIETNVLEPLVCLNGISPIFITAPFEAVYCQFHHLKYVTSLFFF